MAPEHRGRVCFFGSHQEGISQSECLRSKNLQAINAGEDVEKREPSYTIGENVSWFRTMENSMEVPKKAKNRAIMIQESLSWAYTQTKL